MTCTQGISVPHPGVMRCISRRSYWRIPLPRKCTYTCAALRVPAGSTYTGSGVFSICSGAGVWRRSPLAAGGLFLCGGVLPVLPVLPLVPRPEERLASAKASLISGVARSVSGSAWGSSSIARAIAATPSDWFCCPPTRTMPIDMCTRASTPFEQPVAPQVRRAISSRCTARSISRSW